jgi:hypothetical protein
VVKANGSVRRGYSNNADWRAWRFISIIDLSSDAPVMKDVAPSSTTNAIGTMALAQNLQASQAY